MVNSLSKERKMCLYIFVVCMVLSIIFTVAKTGGILKERSENEQRVETGLISNAISNEFLRPITVADTMSKDANLKLMMCTSSRGEALKYEQNAAIYLDAIKNGFGYSMVYAVSEGSKAYYTYDGISRFVDDTLESSDLWYKNFIESGEEYKLDVDTDVDNDWALSVFINTAIYDDNGRLIGVCGIGTEMVKLQAVLEKYEDIYDVKINLVNHDGLIQIDTDTLRIEKDYINISDLNEYADGECYFEINDKGNRTITYLKDLDWFLVVQSNRKAASYLFEIVAPNIICLVIGLAFIIFISCKKKKDNTTK